MVSNIEKRGSLSSDPSSRLRRLLS